MRQEQGDQPLSDLPLLDLYGPAVERYAGCFACFSSEAPHTRSSIFEDGGITIVSNQAFNQGVAENSVVNITSFQRLLKSLTEVVRHGHSPYDLQGA